MLLAVCPPVFGHTKHAPLPEQILQAKTVYIDNQSGLSSFGDAYVSGYHTSTTSTAHGTEDDSGNIQMSGNSQSETSPNVTRVTYLTAIDPKTGDSLWSDQKVLGNLYMGFRSATRSLVKELRKRIEEQEAGAKGKGKK